MFSQLHQSMHDIDKLYYGDYLLLREQKSRLIFISPTVWGIIAVEIAAMPFYPFRQMYPRNSSVSILHRLRSLPWIRYETQKTQIQTKWIATDQKHDRWNVHKNSLHQHSKPHRVNGQIVSRPMEFTSTYCVHNNQRQNGEESIAYSLLDLWRRDEDHSTAGSHRGILQNISTEFTFDSDWA